MDHADSHQPQTQSTEQTPSSVASLHSIELKFHDCSRVQRSPRLEVHARVVEMLASW